MKALLLTAPSKLELVDFPDPSPAADEVVVRIRACGICGSDIHGWDGSTGRRRTPLIMGHEASGEIVATGPRVKAWRAGDRVTFDSTISCGTCRFCTSGQINLCENRRVVGVSPAEYKQHGAFAERLALPDRILYRLPDNLPFEQAAMVEPVSIAVHAVQRTKIAPGSTAVVIGSGMIGLLVIQALRWAGATQVVAVDLADNRLELARQLGATHTVNSGRADVAAEVARITGGLGADTAFEVVGFTPTVNLALAVLKRGGTCVLVGNLSPQTQDFPLQAVVTKELTLLGSCASAGEYPLCLDLIARGVIDVRPMIETVAPLADGASWFERLSARDGGKYMKVILQP
ncbi:MAG: galactitol-1-phosphate 5-dehydrogenase [Opitutaceae bacterium]|nr:galactitol-1-phosphate 5-dehydrogenase [Opitutaceae bacterium]